MLFVDPHHWLDENGNFPEGHPQRRPCPGLMTVVKQPDDRIFAMCPECGEEEAMIQNWQGTRWGGGLPAPVRITSSHRN